jgi:hypothetical protein
MSQVIRNAVHPPESSIQARAVFESAEVSLQTQLILIQSLFQVESVKGIVDGICLILSIPSSKENNKSHRLVELCKSTVSRIAEILKII